MFKEKLKQMGFDNVAMVSVSKIPFEPSLIELCKMNSCGNYGKSYTCPPYVGETQELIKKAKSYENAIVFQKIYTIEDSFDIEGMTKANEEFSLLTDDVLEFCKKELTNFLLLGAGGCRKCKVCGVVDNIPCRFPDKARSSLESYSIQVSTLAQLCDMKYINGVNTVTYFGAVLTD